jgi:plastocyanin
MKIHGTLAWFAFILLASIATGQAATVTATGSDMFSGTPLTINAGDSVTFKNVGGGEHNVRANDNSFRCANGCDDSGGNGTPSTANWSFTRTFNTPGTVGYYCETHGSPTAGMRGSIIVKAVTPPPPTITIGGYMSGNWFNPNQGGSGFQIEAATNNNMIVIWFVYSPDGTQQNWIYAQGTYDTTSNTATLPAELLTGAKFPPNFNPADVHKLNDANWGTITFTFSDCNTGTVSWHSDFAGYNGQNDTPMAISRLTQIDGTTCPQ